ncbi:MAG: hypothetical protein AAB772_01200 [Patescibacteria group bacterium]
MRQYVLVARSHKYPDIYVKVIEANDDMEAMKLGKTWMKDDMGFIYRLTVAQVIHNDFEEE